ncbi:hypothetical protein [Sporisorium scitamineum]|uniref:Uncharacterized protein n=1 Tax=Sporisorium scitamineum TaxID=49012 RepID=A0A0F7RU07_9BASI|nr:hypothetical protein [Sporisorium scitamineum]
MLFVVLPQGHLPRSAAVEWQITAHTGPCSTFGILTLRRLSSPTDADADSKDAFTTSIRNCVDKSYATQLFQPVTTAYKEALALLKDLLSSTTETLLDQSQIIPCSSVHTLADDSTAQQVDLALVWHGI